MWISSTYLDGMPFRFKTAPPGVDVRSEVLTTADRREVRALYWTPAGPPPKIAVVAMHPRIDFTHHYTFPGLLAAGIGCLGAMSRNLGDDTDTIHEDLVLDVAACVRWLSERVETVVLLGNCGGGSLMGLYQSQAEAAPAERIARTPGGRRSFLREAPLPKAAGLVIHAAHRGQGRVLLRTIDPSVTDEADPLSVDPSLDPYDPRNGFVRGSWSTYDPAFVARYREAQRARVERLDGVARGLLAERKAAKGTDERRAHLARLMVIYRTSASLESLDRTLDPSNRDYGTLLSEQPEIQNLERLGYARVLTPEAWLSTWSGLSSNADLAVTLRGVGVPVLLVHAGADREVLNSDLAAMQQARPDATVVTFETARHYFEPDRQPMNEALAGWIRERFA